MPDPDELAVQHETFLEERARRRAEQAEERYYCEMRRRGMAEADIEDRIGGVLLETSPWECPSKRAGGHPQHCGMFDDPPICSTGDCIIREEETVNG